MIYTVRYVCCLSGLGFGFGFGLRREGKASRRKHDAEGMKRDRETERGRESSGLPASGQNVRFLILLFSGRDRQF
jgi:hypothetical protein